MNLYNKEKLLLSFEYGLAIGEAAREREVRLTPEMVKRAEEIIEKEFKGQTAEYCATHMVPNILAVFETN